MTERKHKTLDKWVGWRTDGWLDQWKFKQTGGWIDETADRWVDAHRNMVNRIWRISEVIFKLSPICVGGDIMIAGS